MSYYEKWTNNVYSLRKIYDEHFFEYASRIINLNSADLLEQDEFFTSMPLSKANSYKVTNGDVFIYALYALIHPPHTLANYVKFPQNKIVFLNYMKDQRNIQKSIAECFELTLAENKAINKKEKSKFDHHELNTITNKMLMGLDLVYYYRHIAKLDVYDKVVGLLNEGDTMGAALHYLLAYVGYPDDVRLKIKNYIKEQNEMVSEKIKLEIERFYNFSVSILKLSKKERYDLYIDEQLVKMTEYMTIEKENMINAFSKDEQRYLDMIDNLTVRLNQLEKENLKLKNTSMKKTSPLKDKNVLVVGDTSRRESYRGIVEQYGGHFDFVDGIDEKEKVKLSSESADVAIVIIPRIKHTVSHILKSKKVPVIFVNSAGIGSFEEAVDEYCS